MHFEEEKVIKSNTESMRNLNLCFIPSKAPRDNHANDSNDSNGNDEMKRSMSVNDLIAIQSIDFIQNNDEQNRFLRMKQLKAVNEGFGDQQKGSISNDQWTATFVPPQPLNPSPNAPFGYNPLTSFTVEQTRNEVVSKLCEILSTYTRDIDFSVRGQAQSGGGISGIDRIEGVVFMNDHNEVFFMISVFNDGARRSETNWCGRTAVKSKIEFVRKSGSSLSFAQFWGDIKRRYLNAIPHSRKDEVESCDQTSSGWMAPMGSLPDLDISALPPLEGGDHYPWDRRDSVSVDSVWRELDEFSADLRSNDQFVADFIRIFCHSKLGKTIPTQKVLNHEKTICALIRCAMNQCDIRVARGSMIILTAVIEECNDWKVMAALMERNGMGLMRSIICNLNSQSVLIQKHAIRLLSALSTASRNVDWNAVFKGFGDGFRAKTQLETSCRQFAARWNAQRMGKYYGMRDGIEQAMFENIERFIFR